MEEGKASRGSNSSNLSSNLLIAVGIPWLKDGDEYEKYLKKSLEAIKSQECPVEILEPYVTKPLREPVADGIGKIHQITEKLNEIINYFYTTKATHLAICDADIEIPKHGLKTLLFDNVDIASGVYYPRNRRDVYCAGRLVSHVAKKYKYIAFNPNEIKHLVTDPNSMMVAAGNGCLLIKRRVFSKVHADIDPLRFMYEDGGRGSDIQFFINAQLLGFKALIDGRVYCGHLPDNPLSESND